eukprot:sb/3463398/
MACAEAPKFDKSEASRSEKRYSLPSFPEDSLKPVRPWRRSMIDGLRRLSSYFSESSHSVCSDNDDDDDGDTRTRVYNRAMATISLVPDPDISVQDAIITLEESLQNKIELIECLSLYDSEHPREPVVQFKETPQQHLYELSDSLITDDSMSPTGFVLPEYTPTVARPGLLGLQHYIEEMPQENVRKNKPPGLKLSSSEILSKQTKSSPPTNVLRTRPRYLSDLEDSDFSWSSDDGLKDGRVREKRGVIIKEPRDEEVYLKRRDLEEEFKVHFKELDRMEVQGGFEEDFSGMEVQGGNISPEHPKLDSKKRPSKVVSSDPGPSDQVGGGLGSKLRRDSLMEIVNRTGVRTGKTPKLLEGEESESEVEEEEDEEEWEDEEDDDDNENEYIFSEVSPPSEDGEYSESDLGRIQSDSPDLIDISPNLDTLLDFDNSMKGILKKRTAFRMSAPSAFYSESHIGAIAPQNTMVQDDRAYHSHDSYVRKIKPRPSRVSLPSTLAKLQHTLKANRAFLNSIKQTKDAQNDAVNNALIACLTMNAKKYDREIRQKTVDIVFRYVGFGLVFSFIGFTITRVFRRL